MHMRQRGAEAEVREEKDTVHLTFLSATCTMDTFPLFETLSVTADPFSSPEETRSASEPPKLIDGF